MNHPYTEADIMRFVRGGLTEQERKEFEMELTSNQALVDEVERIRLALLAIERKGEDALKSRFEKLERWNVLRRRLAIIFILLAIVVIGFVIKNAMSNKKPLDMQTIYADNIEKYRPPVTIRNNEKPIADLTDAIEAYNDQNYDQAFELFSVNCNETNQEACFYSVLSAIYHGDIDYRSAKNELRDESPYLSIILWYEGLYYLNKNDKNEAVQYFEELLQKGDYKKTESSEILKQLGEMK